MRKFLCLAVALASLSNISSAQTITETFGTGANAFMMDFVRIGNPNNAADTTGSPNPAGSVAYTYNIGKHEVSVDMFRRVFSLLGGNGDNKPVLANWYQAAEFINHLNTSQGFTPAYKFTGYLSIGLWAPGEAGYNPLNRFRNSLARYWLPNTDEWYKSAYGGPNGDWYNFPTGSDLSPVSVAGGTDQNTAVFSQSGPADITNAGGLSAWGTMAQGGNVDEWIEGFPGPNLETYAYRPVRGGDWESNSGYLEAVLNTVENNPVSSNGFRVVMIPEPSSLSLLALGGVVVAIRRRR